jgi:DNA-binding response OmpR family regulator
MGKKILVVDDDSIIAKIIDMSLSRRGHEVKVFHSGVDAVRHIFVERPDSVVLDIRLPDCDGWFIAKLLEKVEGLEKVPIIVTSVLEPDHRKVDEHRPYAYIQKPFDMGQLVEAVEGSLSGGLSPAGG